MTRYFVVATVLLLLATTTLVSAPSRQAPDFWYVVPSDAPTVGSVVRGIVIPSSVTPTVETSAGGSVLSWRRGDGMRQSFAVQGVSAVTFEPGPLKGTFYVPFGAAKRLVARPDESCCSCATWLNSRESIEQLGCVAGCSGCHCEGCICSPTLPCPSGPTATMTLTANTDRSSVMTFDEPDSVSRLSVAGQGRRPVQFRGRHLSAEVAANGETRINNPDSIVLPGRVVSSSTVRGEKALFAWVSPDASVILEQPRSMPAPSLRAGTIEFDRGLLDATETRVKYFSPVADRCRACGTHPDSDSDLDIYDCVPGISVCYRCVSWEC